MLKGLRQKVIVKQGGLIELLLPELPDGATVDVIVLLESPQVKPPKKHPLSDLTKEEQIAKIRSTLGGWEDDSSITAIFSEIDQKRHAERGRPLVSFEE